MRGLIYKDFSIFFKCIDKKVIAIAVGFTALLIFSAGNYGGLMASIMFAMTVGMQNIISLAGDERAGWKKYQRVLPMSGFSVVASKYISVLLTLGISLLGSIIFNLLSGVISGSFDPAVWGLGMFGAVFLPLLWTGICLPLTYWFGVQSAQAMGLVIVIPVFYMVKYFEDGVGFSVMADSLMSDSVMSYLLAAGIAVAVIFGLSVGVSVLGYERRR